LEPEEKKTLEASWNDRHGIHFSRNNSKINTALRDYFDRRRDECLNEDGKEYPGVKPLVRYRPTWLLTVGCFTTDVDPSKSSASRAAEAAYGSRKHAKPWNDRHHVTHSAANHHYHDATREYFSKHVEPRSRRVLPQQQKGIMKTLLPYAQVGNPDGCDEEPSTADLMLIDDDRLPPLPGPGARLPASTRAALAIHVPGRPDASFDSFGE